jgi:hypothetical protein
MFLERRPALMRKKVKRKRKMQPLLPTLQPHAEALGVTAHSAVAVVAETGTRAAR